MNCTPYRSESTRAPSAFMARRRFGFFLTCAVLLGAAGGASAADPGLVLAQRVYDRPEGKDVTTVVTMQLSEDGKRPRERKMLVFRANGTKGEASTLIRFTDPADIQGTGLLTLDTAEGNTDQWIYLPAMQRVRRVDSSRQGGRFVNSDYYFEDLKGRKPGADSHRILGREKIEDTLCEVLESIPVQADNSVYVKRLSWIDPKSLLPLRMDFFERQADQPSKRLLVTRRQQVQGYWTAMDSMLTDLQTGHQTRLTVERALYDRQLPSGLFTSRALADERMERDLRP